MNNNYINEYFKKDRNNISIINQYKYKTIKKFFHKKFNEWKR